jgi:hypothetical protein
VALVVIKTGDQTFDLVGRPFDPLEKHAAAEYKHSSDIAGHVAALRPLDDAANLDIVNACGGTAAVNKSGKNWRGVVRVCVTGKTILIEHKLDRLIWAEDADAPETSRHGKASFQFS